MDGLVVSLEHKEIRPGPRPEKRWRLIVTTQQAWCCGRARSLRSAKCLTSKTERQEHSRQKN